MVQKKNEDVRLLLKHRNSDIIHFTNIHSSHITYIYILIKKKTHYKDVMNIVITKQPQHIFYKDDTGGKSNNIHITFNTEMLIYDKTFSILLFVYDDISNNWVEYKDQNVLIIYNNIDTTTTTTTNKHSDIDIYCRVNCVSYRNDNQPYRLRIGIGDFYEYTTSFYVKSKSRKKINSNNNTATKHNHNIIQYIIRLLQGIIIKLQLSLEKTHNMTDECTPIMSRDMSIDSFDFLDDLV